MNLAFLSLIGAGLWGAYAGFKKKDPQIDLTHNIFDKIGKPIYNLLSDFHSNSLLQIDKINDDSIEINMPLKTLYGVKLSTTQTIPNYFGKEQIDEIIRDFKQSNDAFIYYVLHKQGNFQKQYILTHNKTIARTIAKFYNIKLLSGIELTNMLYNAYLQNSFFIDDKQLHQSLYINKDTKLTEPEFLQFRKLAGQAIRKDLNEVSIFQAYKHLNINESKISEIFRLNFEGSIWFYIDFSQTHIINHIDRLTSYAFMIDNYKPFKELKEQYSAKNIDCAVINAVAYLKNYDDEVIGSLGSYLKTAFIPKEIRRTQHLQKMPLKFRDPSFDFIVEKSFLNNFIASVHKTNTPNPDIFGTDKNGSFLNYSYSAENDNPHSIIIAKTGSGKSASKQKIISQMIDLDFKTGLAKNLGKSPGNVRIRSYDIGFSDEKLINLIKSNPQNDVGIIDSSIANFNYNIVNIPNWHDAELREADIQFNIDLCSVILDTQKSKPLNIEENACFKKIFYHLYENKEFTEYKITNLSKKHKILFEELLNLGYTTSTKLQDIREEKYKYLKVPLLNDFTKIADQRAQSEQLKKEEKEIYQSLSTKLSSIDNIGIFSTFDKFDINDTDVLYMELNNFKDNSLFTPIFFAIFQKTYLKDRDYALWCKRKGISAPKLFYTIEEARNFFRGNNEIFLGLFDKIAREARKYNCHLCIITQNADDIPFGILKNIATRIFMLEPNKKAEVIAEVKQMFGDDKTIPKNLEIGLLETQQYEMCVWYSKGVFNMRFDISADEMKIFSTNPNNNLARNRINIT